MSADDCLQLKSMFVDRFYNVAGSITRIDADRAPGFFAADNARVLLESSDRDFFDDHDVEPSFVRKPLLTRGLLTSKGV